MAKPCSSWKPIWCAASEGQAPSVLLQASCKKCFQQLVSAGIEEGRPIRRSLATCWVIQRRLSPHFLITLEFSRDKNACSVDWTSCLLLFWLLVPSLSFLLRRKGHLRYCSISLLIVLLLRVCACWKVLEQPVHLVGVRNEVKLSATAQLSSFESLRRLNAVPGPHLWPGCKFGRDFHDATCEWLETAVGALGGSSAAYQSTVSRIVRKG